MAKATWQFVIGASLAAGISAIATAPALAAGIALSANPITKSTGTAVVGQDYLKYQAVDSNNDGIVDRTTRNDNADLNQILQGDCVVVAGACSPSGSPGGNVELFADSEQLKYLPLQNFKNAPITSLTGSLFGMNVILSSLNGADWFTTKSGTYSTTYGADNLATRWFKDAFTANGFGSLIGSGFDTLVYAASLQFGLFQRFSDPNISYVNQDSISSKIRIGLAGHFDATTVLEEILPSSILGNILSLRSPDFVNKPLQASEVIKVVYGGITQYKYSFTAAQSGLTASDDGISHNGNYEVSVDTVPEPTTMVGLGLGVAGLLAAKRKRAKTA
ncbi:MAG: NF038130 family PEP-CTERM protein [Actinomycetota bacterium]